MKQLSYLLLAILISGCYHTLVLKPKSKWAGKELTFEKYSIKIPNHPQWYLYNVDSTSQSLILASPKFQEVEVYSLHQKNDEKAIIFKKSGGFYPPIPNEYFKSWVEIYFSPIPNEWINLKKEEIATQYLESDIAFYRNREQIKTGTRYELKSLKKEGTELEFQFTEMKIDYSFPFLRVACSVYKNNNQLYVLVGKLWTRKEPTPNEKHFLAHLLFNIEQN